MYMPLSGCGTWYAKQSISVISRFGQNYHKTLQFSGNVLKLIKSDNWHSTPALSRRHVFFVFQNATTECLSGKFAVMFFLFFLYN